MDRTSKILGIVIVILAVALVSVVFLSHQSDPINATLNNTTLNNTTSNSSSNQNSQSTSTSQANQNSSSSSQSNSNTPKSTESTADQHNIYHDGDSMTTKVGQVP